MHSTKTLLPVKSTHMHRVAQKIPHHFTSKKKVLGNHRERSITHFCQNEFLPLAEVINL